MKLKFSKMHGLGNDFMVIDGINQNVELSAAQISTWADRHRGIGFDQLLLVEASQSAQALFRYRIFNADGGEVEQCGNGARCFARFVRERGLTEATRIPVETKAGLMTLEMIDNEQVRVNMGVPGFEPAEIPFNAAERAAQYPLQLDDEQIRISALAIGNPHAVVLVDDVNSTDVAGLGARIESHPDFPERVNAGFLHIVDRSNFHLRVFERGVGETMACGSGACAAMVAGRQLGLLDPDARAILRGGDLLLHWSGEGEPVMMTGSTAMVFEGEIKL